MRIAPRIAISVLLILSACKQEKEEPLPVSDSGVAADGSAPDIGTKDGGELDGAVDSGVGDGGPPDTGVEEVTISPSSIDFGRTVIGTAATRSFTIANGTRETVVVSTGLISGSAAAELSLVTPLTDRTLLASESVEVTLEYRPSVLGAAIASLEVELCASGCNTVVALAGIGVTEAIGCAPSPLDFGFVNPGACATRDISCSNTSSQDAVIAGWLVTPSSSPAFTVMGSTTAPATLGAGEALVLSVDYCPAAVGNDSGTIAVTIVHPDPRYTNKAIPLVGAGGGPNIQCTPSVDFGITGIGAMVQRNAACTNTGDLPLLVSAAAFAPGTTTELAGQLRFNGGPAALPLTLQPNEQLEIQMTFAPTAAGSHITSFAVTSNDADMPSASIAVTAEALVANGCTIQLARTAIDFGAVSPGASAEAEAAITNIGTTACAVNVSGVSAASDPEFTLVGGAQSINLAPAASTSVRARFSPTAEGQFTGELELTTTDVNNASPRIVLAGQGLVPFGTIRLIPAAIDFGSVQAGCTNAAERTFTVQNNGAADAIVTITLEAGSASAFAVVSPNPITIPAGGSFDSIVRFQPAAVGTFSGRIAVSAQVGPTFYLTLAGEGAAAAATTVTYPGQAAPEIDVLLVVDDSCSMTEEQARLSQVASVLLARGDASGARYHVGVTTTDTSPGIAGTLRGTGVVPWTSATRSTDLAANINVGINGAPEERGLLAATEAATNTALLVGTNAGFLRPDAELVVIILSDEEDQSPNTVASYLAALTARPTGAPGTPRIYTLSGGPTGCSTPQTPTAPPAPRYVEAATDSGGFDRSICEADYTQIMTAIADATFAPRRLRLPLGAAPVPGSSTVLVGGVAAPAGSWGIDYLTNELVFVPGSAPPSSQTISVSYTGLCVPSTCGNGSPQVGEQCDDGNPINDDACLDTCLNAFCGDGFLFNEGCDDGNTVSGDGCNQQCTIEGCGNGIIEAPEQCDDGNANSNTLPDACRLTCVAPFCGDTVTDTGEQCDDGNAINTDACVTCAIAFCGDGFPQAGVEECDDGNQIDTDACTNACTSNLINFLVTSFPNTPFVPAAGTNITLGDDQAVPVAIGFPFEYLGVAQTDVVISSNGFIAFDPTQAQSFSNVALPNVQAPNAMVAWWWDDLHPGRTNVPTAPVVRSELSGTAPNRVRTITYLNIPHFGNEMGQVSGEIRLHEGTNVIEVHYGSLVDPGVTNWSASTGWEAQGGTRGADTLACGATCAVASWPANTLYVYTPQ